MDDKATTTQHLLRDCEFEEVLDLQAEIEHSFGIEWDEHELERTKTFGQLCDLIQTKIHAEPTGDCTHQQAFYKLRDALAATTGCDKGSIRPATRLRSLIPRMGRRKFVLQLDTRLGFPTNLLATSMVAMAFGGIGLVGGIVLLFYFFIPGLISIAAGILGTRLLNHLMPDLAVGTVGELAQRIASENYRKVRRDPHTYNPDEIEGIVKELMVDRMDIDPRLIHRDAEF